MALADEKIAQAAALRDIREVAGGIGLEPDELETHGPYVAKLSAGVLDRLAGRPMGRYIHVTSMTPMLGWEDSTITSIALVDALKQLGKRAACCLQQPSLAWVLTGGPIRAGGGRCQVVPRDRFALGLTGDLNAVAAAHQSLSAMADAVLVRAGPDGLDPRRMALRRCQDVADNALRQTVVGLGGGVPRESGFDSTPSSEAMAILTLSSSLAELRQRLGRIVVGYNQHELPVFADGLKAGGAMAALVRDALRPNLMQTLDGSPVFVHGASAIDLSHGGASVLADAISLRCCEYVVTTSVAGAELGLEKFCDIKCRASGLVPDAVVLIATVRGVKYQSGRYHGHNDPRLAEPSLQAVREGSANLAKQLENVHYFGLPCVVVIHRGPNDTPEELQAMATVSGVSGAAATVIAEYRDSGGSGAIELAQAAMAACGAGPSRFSLLYETSWPIAKKIETIATTLYNAGRVQYLPRAAAAIERYTHLGWHELTVCMAKTVYSLSHDPRLLGRPYDYVLPIEDVRVAAGAGFLIVQLGPIHALSPPVRRPRAMDMDVTADGDVKGLFR
jgi:formate--tetrahydrofolate ligase